MIRPLAGLAFLLFVTHASAGSIAARPSANSEHPALSSEPASGSSLDPKNILDADLYSRAHGGEALRVEQNGRVLFADYAKGMDEDTARKIYSGTKSYFSVIAMVLVQKGQLRLNELASDTLTEWKNDARRSITIDELLSQTSGLSPDGDSIYASRDQLEAAVHIHLVSPPGTRFHYGAAGYQAFGEILKRRFVKPGQSVEDFVRDTLLEPYDLRIPDWKKDDDGNVMIHAGMFASAKEWARFGDLVMRPVLTPADVRHNLGFPQLFIGHTANPAYGLGFWLNNPQPAHRHQPWKDLLPASDGDQIYPGGPRDLITCMGTGKQRLYIIPSLQLVIVRFAHEAPYSDGDFLSRLITGKPNPDKHTH